MPAIGWEQVLAAAALGLLVGSFLNVVIHRLPLMLERRWKIDCAELSGQPAPETAALNLMQPRSRCPHCGHAIAWYENIPVLSYLGLRGRCSACAHPIHWRYPAIEMVTALVFGACAVRWGLGVQAVLWAGFSASLLALAAIDWDTTLLPDDITLPLLWAGLVAAQLGFNGVTPSTALWGAVAGYLSLWGIFWAFKLLTGKDGMGYGDFKLFAAIGAWMGWQALVPVLLAASVVGAVVGLVMKSLDTLREGGVVPFGPFLALGALGALVLQPPRVLAWLGW